jgi:hypothetical protein
MSEFHFVAPAGTTSLLGTPLADFNDGGNVSDVVNVSLYEECYFMVQMGARTGTTAAPVITVLSCDDTTPTNSEAVAFEYKLLTSGETSAAWVAVASTGYTVVSGDDQCVIVRVRTEKAFLDYEYMQLSMTEPANDPQVGAVLIMLAKPSYDSAVLNGVLT